MLKCKINDDYIAQVGNIHDKMQLGASWIKIDELDKYRIYPSILKDIIKDLSKKRKTQV